MIMKKNYLMQIRMISGEKSNISHVIKRCKPAVLMDIKEVITLLIFEKNIIIASSIVSRYHHLTDKKLIS